jgi:transcriptional regulator with XRE-family HTH domain
VTSSDERRRELAERFGENVRRHRERRELSQDDLAREMADRGWQYYQSTVYKIEHGERKVSFGEAVDLAAILKVTLDRFTWTGAEANESGMADRTFGLLHQAFEEAVTAAARLAGARAGAEYTLTVLKDSKYPRTRKTCEALAAELDAATIDAAVAEGAARHKKLEH